MSPARYVARHTTGWSPWCLTMAATLVSTLLASAPLVSAPLVSTPLHAQRPAHEQPLVELYTLATAALLGDPGVQEFILLPSSSRAGVTVRPRASTGDPFTASPAVASRVAARLRSQGYRGALGSAMRVSSSQALQLVLGEVRFEPAREARFARVAIGAIGSDGSFGRVQVLLRHDDDRWRALSSRLIEAPERGATARK